VIRLRSLLVSGLLATMLLAGCSSPDVVPAEEEPMIVPPAMLVPDTSPPRGAPQVELTTTDHWGIAPLKFRVELEFERMDGRTVEWKIDEDDDGIADAWGTFSKNDSIIHVLEFAGVGAYPITALATWQNATLLYDSVTAEVFSGDQYKRTQAYAETDTCTSADAWYDADEVDDVGNHDDDNHTVEFRIDDDTHGQTYHIEWDVESGFHEVWLFFTDVDGEIKKSKTSHLTNGGVLRFEGTVPSNAEWVVLHLCGAATDFQVRYVA
jgi:hypothetical protein